MKKLIKYFIPVVSLLLMLNNGCSELESLPLNVPIEVNFSTSGNNSTITASQSFCLSDYSTWTDNQDNIKSAKYVSAAYWTLTSSSGLTGNIVATLADNFGNILFSITINNAATSDYVNNPFVFQLSQAEIDAVNSYLANLNNNDQCFIAKLSITNISGGSTPYQLTGKVELVIEAEVKIN